MVITQGVAFTPMKIAWHISRLLVACVLMACGESGSNKLHFVNRASWPVDSIALFYNKKVVLGSLAQGQSLSFSVGGIETAPGAEGFFTGTVYHGGRELPFTWGFHDGYMRAADETLFVFDHVVWARDVPPAKPDSLEVFVINLATEPVDSILAVAGKPIRIMEYTPRNLKVFMPFDSISKYRRFGIASGGRHYSTRMDFVNFEHWRPAQAILYFTGDSLTPMPPHRWEPLELEVDLRSSTGFSLDDAVITGAALVKVYHETKPVRKRLVFDWKKLTADPVFRVEWQGRSHPVNLRQFGFPDPNHRQLLIILDSNGVRNIIPPAR